MARLRLVVVSAIVLASSIALGRGGKGTGHGQQHRGDAKHTAEQADPPVQERERGGESEGSSAAEAATPTTTAGAQLPEVEQSVSVGAKQEETNVEALLSNCAGFWCTLSARCVDDWRDCGGAWQRLASQADQDTGTGAQEKQTWFSALASFFVTFLLSGTALTGLRKVRGQFSDRFLVQPTRLTTDEG